MAAVESGSAGFFAIDERIWAKVTTLGMNEAVAYLVLACGTGHCNKATSWSTNAVMKYAGVGWARAKPAIVNLGAGGFIRCAESHTEAHPRYELATYRELVEYEVAANPPAAPDYFEQELLTDLQAGRQPTNKTGRARGERLLQRSLISKDVRGIYKLPEPAAEDSGDYSIWLPNTIVTGTSSGEESPIQRLRSAGCVWTLRLFVDLYAAQNLRDDGGITQTILKNDFERMKVGEQGAYNLWGFKSKSLSGKWVGPIAAHRSRQRRNPKEDALWDSVGLLQRMGLLTFVPHIFENDSANAEPIHAYSIGGIGEAPIEREIGDAAYDAACAMALPSKLDEATEDGFQYFCPILKTKPAAQMFGVARLTYRPHTRRTRAWFAELHQSAQDWIEIFKELAEDAETAASRRKANYA